MKKLLIALVIGLIGYACSEEKEGCFSWNVITFISSTSRQDWVRQ